MSPRDVARALNIGRVVLGTSLVLAPRLSARAWIGRDADRPGTVVVTRAHGIRDALLGAIALHTVDSRQFGPRVHGVIAVCDAVDLGATLAARRRLPAGAAFVAAMAAAGMVGQLWVAARLGAGEPAAAGDA